MTDSRAPRPTAAEMRRALERAGFTVSRQSGSHMIPRNPLGKRVTLPVHAGRTLQPKIVRAILKDAGLTAEILNTLLH